MEPEKIQRINELKRLHDERGLTEEEQKERQALRQEYIQGFRANMEQILEGVNVQEPDGTVRPLQKKKGKH